LISNVAHTTTTVLIEGATGTGKEMVAQAIHQASAQARTGPFVPVNCAALPETLLESELFGHEKGSFTGAVTQRQGRFELANGGAPVPHGGGGMPPAVPAKPLRGVAGRRLERGGGARTLDAGLRPGAGAQKPPAPGGRGGEVS